MDCRGTLLKRHQIHYSTAPLGAIYDGFVPGVVIVAAAVRHMLSWHHHQKGKTPIGGAEI